MAELTIEEIIRRYDELSEDLDRQFEEDFEAIKREAELIEADPDYDGSMFQDPATTMSRKKRIARKKPRVEKPDIIKDISDVRPALEALAARKGLDEGGEIDPKLIKMLERILRATELPKDVEIQEDTYKGGPSL